MTIDEKKQAPLETFKDGAVTIKLWKQEAGGQIYVNASVGKLYKDDRTGQWHESRSFSGHDLSKLQAMIPEALLSAQAHEYAFNAQRLEQARALQQEAHANPRSNLAAERDAVMSAANKPEHGRTQEHARSFQKDYER